MSNDKAKGNLKQMMGSFKKKWGKITDNELTESKGEQEYLAGKVQEHYGKSKDEAKKEVNEFFKSYEKEHSAGQQDNSI